MAKAPDCKSGTQVVNTAGSTPASTTKADARAVFGAMADWPECAGCRCRVEHIYVGVLNFETCKRSRYRVDGLVCSIDCLKRLAWYADESQGDRILAQVVDPYEVAITASTTTTGVTSAYRQFQWTEIASYGSWPSSAGAPWSVGPSSELMTLAIEMNKAVAGG